jgi:nitroreductase
MNKPVPEELLNRLIEAFDNSYRLNKLGLRLLPMESGVVGHAMTGLMGSYGHMKNPPIWVIGISEDGKNYQENFGYAMEQFILECTREGLGTCWVGGFFKISLLEEAVPKDKDERIVCISPVGYTASRRFSERSMRALGRLNVRKPLHERVFTEHWGNPATQYLASKNNLLEVFELARWAPSASNAQPCHYIVDDERIVISVLTSLQKKYPKFVAKGKAMNFNFQGVDAGIGMAHVFSAAQELGIRGEWTLEIDEPELRKKHRFPDDARIVGAFDYKIP